MRVVVLELQGAIQQSTLREVGDQSRVGFLEELATDDAHLGIEGPVGVERVDHRQVVGLAHQHVFGTESRCDVDKAGAVLGGDVVGQHHSMCVGDVHQVERRLVGGSFEFGGSDVAEHLGTFGYHLAQCLGHYQHVAIVGADHLVGGRG